MAVFLVSRERLDTYPDAFSGWMAHILEGVGGGGEEMTHIKQTELRLEMLFSWRGGWLRGHWSFKKITLRAQESSSAFKGLLDH